MTEYIVVQKVFWNWITISVYLTFVDIFLKVLKKFSKSCTIVQNKGGLPEFSWSFTQVNFHLEM